MVGDNYYSSVAKEDRIEKDASIEGYYYPLDYIGVEKEFGASYIANQFLHDKKDLTRRNISEILSEIEERKRLSQQIADEIDKEIENQEIQLVDISHWAVGYKQGVDAERRSLRDKIMDLKREKRNEETKCFKDLIALRKELSEFIKQDRSVSRMMKVV